MFSLVYSEEPIIDLESAIFSGHLVFALAVICKVFIMMMFVVMLMIKIISVQKRRFHQVTQWAIPFFNHTGGWKYDFSHIGTPWKRVISYEPPPQKQHFGLMIPLEMMTACVRKGESF